MTLHKISAGDGYTYLTRQVAAGDNTDRSRDSLAAYYGSRGESPGRWTGRLAATMGVAGTVTEAQMLALFGEGRHPNAASMERALVAGGTAPAIALASTRLGHPFPAYDTSSQFPTALATAYAAHNTRRGERARAAIGDDVRAEIRTRVARDMFTIEFRRPPADARELSGWIARNTRPDRVAIAGYDLTFSPAKSVSVLWALAPRDIGEKVAAAHDAAVATVLDRIETEAAYTRQGRNGVRQVKVDGVIAAAFTHRSSRAGDPDLHTHVTVAAKVQAPDGSWLTLDGRMLYKGNVTYSEMYNSALETELLQRVPGLRFVDVARTGAGGGDKRPVRELAGLDPTLLTLMSKRAAAIEPRRAELAAQFVRDHGRTPTRPEQLALAQQATLDTREAKKLPRTHAEERTAWRREAEATVGRDQLGRTLRSTLTAASSRPAIVALSRHEVVERAAVSSLLVVSERRAVWQEWHLRAEAERQVRRLVDSMVPAAILSVADVDQLVDDAVTEALRNADVMPLAAPEVAPVVPIALRNPDGSSQYDVFRAATFTTHTTLAAEARIVAWAGCRDGRRADVGAVETAVLESHANGKTLNTGQAALVRELATSGARFQLALAPAGSGKTTAMKALARGWQLSGGTVVGLAPSAAAASELAASIGQSADTVDKLVHELDRAAADPTHRLPRWIAGVGADTLIVVDEISLGSTAHLDRVLAFAAERGASVRGVGDPAQRSSVAAGGVMRDVETAHGAVSLAEVMRFADASEGAASLALRAGDPSSIAHYVDRGRVHVGDLDTALAAVYDGWAADRRRGIDAVMLAPLRDQVAALNIRARGERLAALIGDDSQLGPEATLARGQQASAGDIVQTRRNDRTLTLGTTDFVRNGYRFIVDHVSDDGALLARHLETGRRVVLTARYLAEHAELGYARTVAAAQGMTAGGVTSDDGVSVRVDGVAHVLVDPDVMDRESLYVAMTRGTAANHAYVVAAGRGDEHAGSRPDTVAPATAAELLGRVLERSSAQTSATTEVAAAGDPFRQLAPAVDQYADALRVGASQLLGRDVLEQLAADAEALVPGVTDAPAWPTLSSHLALLELEGRSNGHPGAGLRAFADVVATRDLTGATDVAAVIDWRLGDTSDVGPLPWLAAPPAVLVADPTWGPYVAHLGVRVNALAAEVGALASRWTKPDRYADVPTWARPLVAVGAHERSLARLAVWRAARDVDVRDPRPTGPSALADAERAVQRDLESVAAGYGINATADARAMAPLAERFESRLLDDDHWPQLATRLRAVQRAGVDVRPLIGSALEEGGPLPDEQAAAALWWRLSPHLAPNLDVDALISGVAVRPTWSADLDSIVGAPAAETVLSSVAWPALVGRIDAAARDGFDPIELLADGLHAAKRAGVMPGELTTAALWHVSLIADPAPPDLEELPPDPADFDVDEPRTELPNEGWLAGATSAVDGPDWPESRLFVEPPLFARPIAYQGLPPAERVHALTVDLTAARAELADLSTAVMTDRGPHVTTAMPQIRELRRRADELAPFVADRDFARAEWQEADVSLVEAQQALTSLLARNASLRTADPSGLIEENVMKDYVDHARSIAATAYGELVAAQAALDTEAGGDAVRHVDATDVWRVASDLDLGVLNARRSEVAALQDDLWRATAAADRTPELSPGGDPAVLAELTTLDYGALGTSEATVVDANTERARDLAPEL